MVWEIPTKYQTILSSEWEKHLFCIPSEATFLLRNQQDQAAITAIKDPVPTTPHSTDETGFCLTIF